MTRGTAVAILFIAALLEAGGDALIRLGLRSAIFWQRGVFFVVAAVFFVAFSAMMLKVSDALERRLARGHAGGQA